MERGSMERKLNDAGPDITNVKDKFPKLGQRPWLAETIGKRITQQRDYIRYRQAHRQKLAKHKTVERVTQDGGSEILSTNATTKATTYVEQVAFVEETDEITEETFTEDSIYTEATSFATTALGDDGLGRSIPSLTTMWLDGVRLDYDKHIECPYCRTIQIIADRRHVYRDLQAYGCTFEGCSSEPFQTSHEWFKHELNYHRRQWKCNQCSTKCHSTLALKNHFTSQHSKTVSAGQIEIMLKACEKAITHFDNTSCPLCNDWKAVSTPVNNSSKFRSHLAKHLQELAREALPLAIDGLEIREEMSDNESVSTDDSDSTYDTPADLAYMVPYGKFIKNERRWRCLMEGRSGLCQTKFSRLMEFRGHAGVAHPELKLARVVWRTVCPACASITTATKCNNCLNPPETEEWLYANSGDVENPIDAEEHRVRRTTFKRKVEDETKRKVWGRGLKSHIPRRREEGKSHDPFMEAYLASEGRNPSFQPSDSKNVREAVPVIKFTDILDRKFHFPLNMCLNYETMTDMVKAAFIYEDLGPVVVGGHFQLLDAEDKAINPELWEGIIEPGSLVGMRLIDTGIHKNTEALDLIYLRGPLVYPVIPLRAELSIRPVDSSGDKTNTRPPPPVGGYKHLKSDARARKQFIR
uniref:Ankyrin repeat protein n=1 Tax=Colletotrichum fructicola (strain Nara gc5) TaxID=1213859 RepID=L2G3K3_COLFN